MCNAKLFRGKGDVAVPRRVAHQSDAPHPPGELAQPAADLDAVAVEQRASDVQIDLFAAPATPAVPERPQPSPLEEALGALQPDELSPREALDALYRLKKLL